MEINKIKILFINLFVEMGGGEYSIFNFLKGINREEFQPIMMFSRRGSFSEKVESLGVETVFIPYQTVELKSLINPKVFWRNIKAAFQIYKYLKNNKVDLIQCSDVLSLLILIPSKILLKIPIIYSVIFQYELLRLLLFNVLSVLFVNKIITNSKFINNYLLNNTMFLHIKTSVVYNGIDINLFQPVGDRKNNSFRNELGITNSTKLIGMVSRFDVWKGHKIFLEAASVILKKNKDIQFVIIGGLLNKNEMPSINIYYNEVMNLYHNLQLGNKFLFIPHRDDMPEVVRGLDILVLPSQNEPFGLVLLEAMASGTLVIASDSGGPLEIIEPQRDGFMFKTNDAESLVTVLDYCLQGRINLSEITVSARKKVEEKFCINEYCRNLEKIYRQEIKEKMEY